MNKIDVTPKIPPQQSMKPKVPEFVKDFAKSMEKQFVDFMLQKMDDNTLTTEADSSAERYYKSLLRDERSSLISQVRSGVGIQDMIISDYMKKFHQQPINQYQKFQKGGGNE